MTSFLTEIDLFAWPAGNAKVANVNHEPFYNDTLLKRRNQRRSRCAQRLWEFFFFLLFITDSAPSLQNLILVHRQQQHQWRDLWKRYLAILSFAHPHGLASCVICVILINFHPLKASRSNHTWRSFLSVIIRVCVCLMWLHCAVPLSGKPNDQQVVTFLPVTNMYQMFPKQQRRTGPRVERQWTEQRQRRVGSI